jgi:hypothetical protein
MGKNKIILDYLYSKEGKAMVFSAEFFLNEIIKRIERNEINDFTRDYAFKDNDFLHIIRFTSGYTLSYYIDDVQNNFRLLNMKYSGTYFELTERFFHGEYNFRVRKNGKIYVTNHNLYDSLRPLEQLVHQVYLSTNKRVSISMEDAEWFSLLKKKNSVNLTSYYSFVNWCYIYHHHFSKKTSRKLLDLAERIDETTDISSITALLSSTPYEELGGIEKELNGLLNDWIAQQEKKGEEITKQKYNEKLKEMKKNYYE